MISKRREDRHRSVAWLGPDPHRVDVAHVRLAPDRLAAHGTSTSAMYTLTYRLETTRAWVTRALDVAVEGDGWRRTLALRRADDGRWSAQRQESAQGEAPVGGPVDLPDVNGARDCDLGLCPLTNTMPILREGMIPASQDGSPQHAELVMAWISVPELHVRRSAQVYRSGTPVVGGGAVVGFSSERFHAHIEVDADGLVVNYPNIGRRLLP